MTSYLNGRLRTTWRRFSLQGKGIALIGCQLGALLLCLACFFWLEQAERRQEQQLRHTIQVRAGINQVLQNLVDAETGVRGYVITQHQEFLQPYHDGIQALPKAISLVSDLLQDDAAQLARWSGIKHLVALRLDQFKGEMKIAEEGADPASAMAALREEKAGMDELRNQLAILDQEASSRQLAHFAGLSRVRNWMFAAFAGGIISCVAGAGAWLLFSTGILRRMRSLENRTLSLSEKLPPMPPSVDNDEIDRVKQGIEAASLLLAAQNQELRKEAARLLEEAASRKHAEEALRETEAFAVNVCDSLVESIAILDAQGVIGSVNRTWQRFAEQNAVSGVVSNSIGQNYLAVCENANGHPHDEDAAKARDGIRAVLNGVQKEFRMEYPCHSPDEQRWFQLLASPLLGSRKGAVIAHLDITGRKQSEEQIRILNQNLESRVVERTSELSSAVNALEREMRVRALTEQALRESENRYRTLFENMKEGFAYCRMLLEDNRPSDFLYLAVNPAFLRLTGFKDPVGKTIQEIVPDLREIHPELFEIYGRVALTGQPETFEICFKPLGTWLAISVYGPERGYMVAVFDDITEQKQLEKAILEVSEAEQKRLGQDLHDDLGQQLTGLSMLAKILSNALAKESHSHSAQAKELAGMLQRTVETSRNLAKGFYPIELELGGFALALLDLTHRITAQTQVNCTFQIEECFQFAKEKEIHLYRIAQEAISNSLKHGKARNIRVECTSLDGIPTLRITDDGVGFQRPEPGKAGMGLHLFKYRARVIGAKIRVAAGEAGGCQVTCSLVT